LALPFQTTSLSRQYASLICAIIKNRPAIQAGIGITPEETQRARKQPFFPAAARPFSRIVRSFHAFCSLKRVAFGAEFPRFWPSGIPDGIFLEGHSFFIGGERKAIF
jgi:hypothetical protein